MSSHRGPMPRYIGGGAPLRVDRSTSDVGPLLEVHGELDRETTPRLATAIGDALAESEGRIEIDLSGVTFMDSQGLRILLEAKRRAGETTEFVVVRPSGQVERLLQATGVADILGLGLA